MGGRHYVCAHEERLCVHRVCHRRVLPKDCRLGVIRLDADFKHCRCKRSTRRPKCAEETTGLIHHSDHGSQYVSVVYNERLAQHGITASTGTVGDWYDNALAENVNGSYKNELIHTRRWDDVVEVEIATFEWVNWWNDSRLHQSLGYRTPVEVEDALWEQYESQEIIENKVNA